MKKTKQKYISSKWTKVYVTDLTKNMFKEYCKNHKVEMQITLDEILLYVIKNKISPNDMESMMDKNITREVKRYHNYNAGFLQEFEKKQLELMKQLVTLVGKRGKGESKILIVLLEEILRCVQFLITYHPPVAERDRKEAIGVGKRILDLNESNLNEVLSDDK